MIQARVLLLSTLPSFIFVWFIGIKSCPGFEYVMFRKDKINSIKGFGEVFILIGRLCRP